MKNKFLSRLSGALLALIVVCIASSAAFASATIVIENGDSGSTGFNDPTPVAPIGGNGGTTLGQQRLIAFQTAANIWGATLTSGPTITIHASWAALSCTANSATLGSAGNSGNIWRDFPGAPLPQTWYGNALTNALMGADQNGAGTAEINAQFNVNLGNTGCLETSHWYYGLDNNHGVNGVDLVAVLMHEFGHGLGFQTFTNSSTGQQAGSGGTPNGGFPSIYDRFLFDNTANKTWAQMTTDTERQASAINTNNLVWIGPRVDADVPNVLSGTPRLRVNSPPGIAGNYQIGSADFGPALSSPGITASVVLATPNDGCNPVTGAVSGKIALIDRGICNFTVKVKNAQNAGALGVIIADNDPANTTPPGMGGTDATITIPSVRITLADGNTIKTQLPSVNATLFADPSTLAGADQLGRPLLFTPNPVQGGSSVSHWDTSATPNQLMEPNINGDVTHSVSPPQDLTASQMKDIGWQVTFTASPTIQFQSANFSVNEGAGSATVTVTRTDSTAAATVDYKTTDTDTFTIGCAGNSSGAAFGRCDFATSNDTLSFIAGQASQSFVVPIIDDVHVEGPETFQVVLSNPSAGFVLGNQATATITIIDNDAAGKPNPMLLTSDPGIAFFVRQHYLDFLAREPEVGEPWSGVLRGCADQFNTNPSSPSAGCDRITVSLDIFGSPEFLSKGIYTIVFYRVAFIRLPEYTEFAPDVRSVTGTTPAETNAKRAAFANNFVLRPEFAALAAMTNTNYVNTLMGRYGLSSITTPDPANPDGGVKVTRSDAQLIAALNGATLTKAQVLRAIVQSDQVTGNAEAVTSYVASQYYGYLRRKPDNAGFNQWVTHLTNNPTDFRTMINGFVNSQEYRFRFGP